MAEVKICGLSTPETMQAALDAGADYVGLNFYPPSPRYIAPEAAAELPRGNAKVVALVVDADDATIDHIAAKVRPDYFQLHGSESPERVAEVASRANTPVIKVIKVAVAADLKPCAEAAMLMYDSKPPPQGLPGGVGLAFDWRILANAQPAQPYMLAGGLTPETVAEAIRLTGAPIVDVSSGVESSPGKKDANLIRRFIAAAKGLS